MFNIEGICDWCKKPSLVIKLEYLDGLHHHSCEACSELARLDVRHYNLAELEHRGQKSD
ncbi:hypothetical protein ACODM8_09035 [Vibrio ostreicida]|uniref:Uncharacterized protein n=1 Tax=Vibrio ostreicida TaxID=526588 RepID=A0ABT8BVP9_9VIBR|nr:hypothetical protein [Vibrio ostreicida]MDN3610177.1 hypothetical protein [Vibrio ostreicida]NPD07802.1 hypothetical protein [Vibrio ostreicida]